YIPLGGNRHGTLRRYANILITMLLGGLWHGAGWTFVAWGAVHGALLVVNHGWRDLRGRLAIDVRGLDRAERVLGATLTFVAVFAAWVLFRAADLHSARLILAGMAGMNGLVVPVPWLEEMAALVRWGVAHGLGGFLGWLPEQLRQVTGGLAGGLVEAAGT